MDKAFKPTKKISLYSAFPPGVNRWVKLIRPVLHFLGFKELKPYTIILDAMNLENLQKYLHLLFQAAEEIREEYQENNGSILEVIMENLDISFMVAQKNPEIFSIATGINDPEFFRSLPATEVEILELAIQELNPSLVKLKKKMEGAAAKIEDLVKEIKDLKYPNGEK